MDNELPLKPVVVGPGRGGFTMCIHVLHQLVRMRPDKRDLRQLVLDETVRATGTSVTEAIGAACDERGVGDRLLMNRNFDRLTGGPKWLGDIDDTLCVRKYVGVAGLGDFTLALSYPVEVADEDNIIHSHIQFKRWPRHPIYSDYVKFATVRNPIGIVNSACFSLNALTSEYLQRFLQDREYDDTLRQELAEYKLTNRDFFGGLLAFQDEQWREFSEAASEFGHVMRWEDIIEHPVRTILEIAAVCDVDLGEEGAKRIWEHMRHRNLTGFHKHNYRVGEGKVGGWKKWLTNEHVEMYAATGLPSIAKEYGYEIEYLDEADYSPFQRRVSAALQRGEVLDTVTDRDLFGFAFNKSNIVGDGFAFHSYDPLPHVHLERSDFRDRELEIDIMHRVERLAAGLNALFRAVLAGDYGSGDAAKASLRAVRAEFEDGFTPETNARLTAAFDKAAQIIDSYRHRI